MFTNVCYFFHNNAFTNVYYFPLNFITSVFGENCRKA